MSKENPTVEELTTQIEGLEKEKGDLQKSNTKLQEELDDAIYKLEEQIDNEDGEEEGEGEEKKEEGEKEGEGEGEEKKEEGEGESKEGEKKEEGKEASDKKKKKLSESRNTYEDTLKKKVKLLEDQVKRLNEDNKTHKTELVTERKSNLIKQLKEDNHYPAFIKVAENIINNDDGEVVMTLTEKNNDGEMEKKLSVSDIILNLANAIPDEGRLHTEEDGTVVKQRRKKHSDEEADVDEIEKYAKDNKMSLSDALVEWDKQGKL